MQGFELHADWETFFAWCGEHPLAIVVAFLVLLFFVGSSKKKK